ncbi:kinase-like domain-containing protein [Fomitopsis serialis]|uniref:kinase-like domain-containing protein n=1 Tax=Fomitopsis serialis TaxID=139415 RepID=UPI0020083A38|nr:kinase-like domain-containing protein [Neoantrodia serialis]KAH9918085.1 kinase-like domain-containing protein [Neoantrodia serialis]
MGFLGDTIRSIKCRAKETANADLLPSGAERQTFEEHRDEYRFLAPVIQIGEPIRAERQREPGLRVYRKIIEDLKNAAKKQEPADLPFESTRVDNNELEKQARYKADVPEYVANPEKDGLKDADPAFVNKILNWAEDKILPVQGAKHLEAPSQLGLAGSPTLCHIPLDAPCLAPEPEPKIATTPSLQPSACESLVDVPEAKCAPPSLPILRASDFRPLKLLGKGGQGTVLLVEHKLAGTTHALKIMAKHVAKTEDKENRSPGQKSKDHPNDSDQGRDARRADKAHKRIYEEQAIMRSLAVFPREKISCFLDFEASFHDNAHFFLLTGYAPRGDLWTEMERYKATGMSEAMILGYAAEIVHVLTVLHSFSVLHRDFKPDNILIDAHGHLLLADFGISRAFDLPAVARPWVQDEPASTLKLHVPVVVKHVSGSSLVLSVPSSVDAPQAESVESAAMHHIAAAPTPVNTEAADSPERAGRRREEQFREQEERDALARHARLRVEVEELQHRKNLLRKLVREQLAVRHMTLNVCGTPGFVAPEVYRGPAYSYGADVWAAGVIVYKMAFGKLPFGLTKKMEMQDRVKQTCLSPLEFPEDSRRSASPAFKDLLSKMLEKDPSKRPQAKDLRLHPYFAVIDWDAISLREGSGPGANAHATQKKADKKLAIPEGASYAPGEDPAPWMDWIAPTLRDKFAARSTVNSPETTTQEGSLSVAASSMTRSRSSRLMQRCKSMWKLSA